MKSPKENYNISYAAVPIGAKLNTHYYQRYTFFLTTNSKIVYIVDVHYTLLSSDPLKFVL